MSECAKKCNQKYNPDNKRFKELDEDTVKKIKSCLIDNKCLKDKDAKFNHRNSAEFVNFKKCAEEKCPNDFNRKELTTPESTPL